MDNVRHLLVLQPMGLQMPARPEAPAANKATDKATDKAAAKAGGRASATGLPGRPAQGEELSR